MRVDPSLLQTLLLLGAMGCGSLVGADYPGEPQMVIQGSVVVPEGLDFESDIGVTLLWSNLATFDSRTQSVAISTSFPARYTLKIYAPPDPAAMAPLLGVQGLPAAIGQIILFEDVDGDGLWTRGFEPIVGGSTDTAVVFVGPTADAVPEQSPILVSSGWSQTPPWVPEPGFQLVDVPIPPVCGLPLVDFLFQPASTETTLQVGYLQNIRFDWNCDGSSDFTVSPTDNEATGVNGCPPFPEDECAFLEQFLNDDNFSSFQDETLIDFYPEDMLACLDDTCPELTATVRARLP